jgi:hypothetical protein|nr:MAG TPA: protein of unknown function DUF4325 [Caudoviricetes sp.]
MSSKINLHKYRTNGSKIFSGRDRGCDARRALKLDELDETTDKIIVSIPKDTWAINSSFFGGLFEASVIKLKENCFRQKYQFQFDDGTPLSSTLQSNIEEGIFDALNDI